MHILTLSCLRLSGDKVLMKLVSEIIVSSQVSSLGDGSVCGSTQFLDLIHSLPVLIPDVRNLSGLRREGSVSGSPVVEVVATLLVSK